MQYQHIGYRIKGFYRLYDYAIKYGMDNEIAKHRHKALIFWERHGIDATMDAYIYFLKKLRKGIIAITTLKHLASCN